MDYVVRGSRFYQTLLMLLPYAVAPAVAAAYCGFFLFNPGRGLIAHFLGEFGYDWNRAQHSGQAMFTRWYLRQSGSRLVTTFILLCRAAIRPRFRAGGSGGH